MHYWESCAINKGGFFEIAFVVVIDTHLPRFEALAYVLPHFEELTHVVIRAVTFAKENFCAKSCAEHENFVYQAWFDHLDLEISR